MKKLKLAALALGLSAFVSSCTVSHTMQVTDNNVGTKVGVAKSKVIGSSDVTIAKAAKNGKITKVATVDVTVKAFLFFVFVRTTVTGE